MKALFNCSVIKNVVLNNEESIIELLVAGLDGSNSPFIYRTKTTQEKVAKAYNTIKKALLNGDKFVEIEL